jgi:hypothetical protein
MAYTSCKEIKILDKSMKGIKLYFYNITDKEEISSEISDKEISDEDKLPMKRNISKSVALTKEQQVVITDN